MLVAGFVIAWLFGRWRGVREALPAVLIVSAIHGPAVGAGLVAGLLDSVAGPSSTRQPA